MCTHLPIITANLFLCEVFLEAFIDDFVSVNYSAEPGMNKSEIKFKLE